jgi:hypothetical protein
MSKHTIAILGAGAAAAAVAATALSSAPPVGPLPPGPEKTVKAVVGETFAVQLPKPAAGRVWRVARAYDSTVVRETTETATRVGYRAVGPGTTRVVFALTRGERSHAYASRTFKVVVTKAGSCPRDLLELTANPIGPAVTAALVGDAATNRPQAVGATVADHDTARGAQVKRQCGPTVWKRTVVVYIVDRALLPSQSAAQRVLFVGRTPSGYRVWERAH